MFIFVFFRVKEFEEVEEELGEEEWEELKK
jgi:hypothetical protein